MFSVKKCWFESHYDSSHNFCKTILITYFLKLCAIWIKKENKANKNTETNTHFL